MVVQLTPAELQALLAVMREAGVASAEVPTTRGTLRVVLQPDMGTMPGDEATPGGWKSPERLDAPFVATEAP